MTQTPLPSRPAPPPASNAIPKRAAVLSPSARMVMPTMTNTGARVVLCAVNGYGKTTIGALGDEPVIVMSPDEQGYMTLYSRGLVPAVPVIQVKAWPELLATLDGLAKDPQGRKTVVLDALAGLEYLCASWVCESQFGGDWGERGFLAFYRGPAQVAREWPSLLARLTACSRGGLDVLLLAHAKIQTFKNPDGPDFDRYEANAGTSDLWGRTRDWAEAVMFGNFRAIVDTNQRGASVARAKGKAIGQQRILRCQYSAAADAKNQYGLLPEYLIPDEPAKGAEAFWALIKNTNAGGSK